MLTVYGIPNCDTVKKALTLLKEADISYEFHDYKKQGISQAKLLEWLEHLSWEELINRNGTTWRGLSDEEKQAVQTAEQALQLMMTKPSVIRRPILERDGQLIHVGKLTDLSGI
jgi:arsenate reductase (glutaredoxin)